MKPEEMPPPDTLIESEGGGLTCAMFFYASEACSVRNIVAENGFDYSMRTMEHDLGDEHPLNIAYADGAEAPLAEWQPQAPEGWKLVAKNDSEDGPVAIFVRPRQPAQIVEPVEP